MKKLSPIILFVYNRPWHTKQTIEALQKNELAQNSELFIHSDGYKSNKDKENVKKVRKYIKTIDGFKKIKIIEQNKNLGLTNSIVSGVTNIINKFGKIIVLEDDLITSPYFLKFMNNALNFYEKEKKVWHISGWNYPINTAKLPDTFLWRTMNCWGWGTWADRWKYYEKNIEKTINTFSKKDIKRFNIDGMENFWEQVLSNKRKKIDTWDIFWYTTIFKKNGLCLNPTQTFVKNIGLDGSGIHCGITKIFDNDLSYKQKIKFNQKLVEDKKALKRIKKFFIIKKIKRIKNLPKVILRLIK